MSMDSAMDSLSSDHSLASSNESSVRIRSPQANGNGYKNHTIASHYEKHHSISPPISPSNHKPLTPSHMISMQHPLSPPHVSTPSNMVGMPPRIAQSLSHLPPHSLGLLNSLQMMHHASPLDLMAAAHHQMPPRSYNSPPPISSSDPTANECKLVDYRGQKVAAFIIQGDTMLCLPQAFELFLKHLVGGLHTVYTKLKRLDIVPLVCNVEQVRILRGLGAIQPGVNRCKLLSCKDFDVLYRDCTTARCLSIKPPESSRPGRPPKRGPVGLSLPASHLTHHTQLKKHRLDNGEYAYENGHLPDISRMDKSPLLANGYNAPPTHLNHMPFMQMNHHSGNNHGLISPSLPPHHQNMNRSDGPVMKSPTMPGMEAIARSGIWENCRAAYEDIVKHLERLRDDRGEERPMPIEQKPRELRSQNASPIGQSPVLNLSKSGNDPGSVGEPSDRSEIHSPEPSLHEDDDVISDGNLSETDKNEKDDAVLSENEREIHHHTPTQEPKNISIDSQQVLNYSSIPNAVAANEADQANQDPSLSSTETLLRNIQGLLKVAADNARQQERQLSYEKAELKMDVLREREVKDSLERQLENERKLRAIYQKRLKKEKRTRRQENLENEMKIKQLENALKATGASAETLKMISEIKNNNEHSDNTQSKPAEEKSSSPESKFSTQDKPTHFTTQPIHSSENCKTWNYSGIDIMSSGAFWQNYQDSLVQEIEMERKARQQSNENDVKVSLQERPNYYNKNSSAIYTSAN